MSRSDVRRPLKVIEHAPASLSPDPLELKLDALDTLWLLPGRYGRFWSTS